MVFNYLLVDSSNKKRKLTIHLVGVEKEADMFPLFECMLALFPKTDICIHMVGLSVSTKIPMEQSSVLIRSAANESSILITLTAAMYGPQHIDGTAFQLPPEMPEEMKNEMNFGQGKPDILIALNASLVAQDEWGSILTCLADTDVKFLVTEQIEQMCLAAISVLPSVGLKSIIDIQPNPFRQPLYGFKKDINLPSWSNAFIFGIGI